MTRKRRAILFYTSVFLFLVIASFAVLYSQGYRFNLSSHPGEKIITQTGGFFVKAYPKQADVYIDGKLEKRTDFLSGSALISDLLPGEYEITVEKTGYFPWTKTLEISEKNVTEAKFVILFPENPKFATSSDNVENFWPTPDGNGLILYKTSPTSSEWSLNLYNFRANTQNLLVNGKDIATSGAEFVSLNFPQNADEADFQVKNGKQTENYTLDFGTTPAILATSSAPNTSSTSTPQNVISFQQINNDVYYLDKTGYVFKSNSTFSPINKLNTVPFNIKQGAKYQIKVFQNYVFIQEDKILYLLSTDSGTFEKFFDGINGIKMSPDSKKLVYFSNNEIWIFYLQDSDRELQKKAGQKVFLTRFSEKIGDVFWMNGDYLVFNAGDNIKISGIDDRGKINMYNLATFKNPTLYFDQSGGKIYILSQNELYSSLKLLP